MQCPDCGSLNTKRAVYCAQCGTKLERQLRKREIKVVVDDRPRFGRLGCLLLLLVFVGLPVLLYLSARGLFRGLFDLFRGG